MDAHVGDQLVVRSRQVGRPDHQGEIVEVLSRGTEHYRVRWSDGRETVLFPGSDATVQPAPRGDPPQGTANRGAGR